MTDKEIDAVWDSVGVSVGPLTGGTERRILFARALLAKQAEEIAQRKPDGHLQLSLDGSLNISGCIGKPFWFAPLPPKGE